MFLFNFLIILLISILGKRQKVKEYNSFEGEDNSGGDSNSVKDNNEGDTGNNTKGSITFPEDNTSFKNSPFLANCIDLREKAFLEDKTFLGDIAFLEDNTP